MKDIHVPEISKSAITASTITTATSFSTAIIATSQNTAILNECIDENHPSNAISPPLFSNILSTNSGPSPEYLQSLLNVNEALLAQSLANTTPMLTPIDERLDEPILISHNEPNKITSLLITPQDTPDLKNTFSDQHDYISNVEPESELIFSPISENSKLSKSTSINTSNTNNNDQGPIQL
jgi:hypothetical protein